MGDFAEPDPWGSVGCLGVHLHRATSQLGVLLVIRHLDQSLLLHLRLMDTFSACGLERVEQQVQPDLDFTASKEVAHCFFANER